MDLGIIFWIVGGLVGFLVLLSLFYAGYVIAPPNQAVVITGGGKQRVLLSESRMDDSISLYTKLHLGRAIQN